MQIKDLQPRQGKVNITLEVTEKAEPRTFEKFGKSGKVCNAKAKDETGTITITLWNDEVDQVSVGDKVTIENGWVSEYQGELQLSAGKYGKMTVQKGEGGSDAPAADAPADQPMEEPPMGDDLDVDEEMVN